MHCPQLCMGIQPGARFPERGADSLSATLYGYFTAAIYRNWPIVRHVIACHSIKYTGVQMHIDDVAGKYLADVIARRVIGCHSNFEKTCR
jgi:hypothetical protein